MRVNLFDLILLPVLILIFGILQARQPLRQYRLWLAGWVCILLGFVVWVPLALGGSSVVLECVRLVALIVGLMFFISSWVPNTLSASMLLLLLSAPCLVVCLAVLGYTGSTYLVPLIAIGESIVVAAAILRLKGPRPRLCIIAAAIAGTAVMIAVQLRGDSESLFSWILVQEAVSCMVLLMVAGSRRRYIGAWMSLVGFASWAAAYVAYQLLSAHGAQMQLLSQLWNTPKYLVGFGMILIVMESDTAQIQALSAEYRLLYESNPQPMWIFDLVTHRFLSVNDAAVQAYGFTRDQFLSMTIFEIQPSEEHTRLAQLLQAGELGASLSLRHQRKDGTVFNVSCSGHDVLFGGHPARFITAADVSEQERINRDLVYRAQHDPLTGLANRMLLEDRAQQMLARAARDGTKVALLTMDADRFKQINDTYGHPIGDECLSAIASRLESRVRDADTLARTGGEEFTALIGGLTSARAAQAAAAAILSALAQPLTLSSNEISVSMSIGIALYPDDGETLEILCQRSDSALYQAKRMGGGCYLMANEEAALEARSAVDVEAALRNAITESTLELAYQPIYDNRGKLARVEALVRGTDEYLRKAGPGIFIPIAEESGLILPLGNWVLDEACRQIAEWRRLQVPEFELAVNVSARQLVQPDFAERVLATLERHHLQARTLHLELTETTLMRDFSSMVRSMERLAEAGVRFSIDDFGTGYSSLARLSELPISTVKIDRSFVLKLSESDVAVGIVRAIVHMSRHLKLEIVAEGVEEAQHIRILRELGCDLFQGYYLGKPLPPPILKETAMRDGGVLPPFRDSAAIRLSGAHVAAIPPVPSQRPDGAPHRTTGVV